MKLRYVATDGQYVEGWPARDHDETDPETAAAKVHSGLYVRDEPASKLPQKGGE